MKKIVARVLIAGFSFGALAAGASAAQPANPGCFGQDRASILQASFIGDETTPGASAWGEIAGERAGTNGQKNRDYKTWCGGDPTE